ncbi:MAG: phosphoribosylanthranilate isomerase [Pseudomonadota bacterium]
MSATSHSPIEHGTVENGTVKICGLSEPATLRAALEAGADMVGFVFFAPSPRAVTPETAAALARIVREESAARVVALSVDADDALLAAITEAVSPDLHQLHGKESVARAADVSARFGPVMKALGVRSASDVASAKPYAEAGAAILFDAPPPPDSPLPGGNGEAFDWTRLGAARTPFLLSGGLTPANAANALRVPGAVGIDVSSGVERAKGVKDEGLIRDFLRAARAAQTTESLSA